MRNVIFIIALFAAAPADSKTTCEFEGVGGSTWTHMRASWNEETLLARIYFPGLEEEAVTGEVALIRTGGRAQKIVHLIFTGVSHLFLEGDSEFIVHESAPGEFSSYGVGYVTVDGVKYLGNNHGLYVGKCRPM